MSTTIYIKNMVCDRCIMAVRKTIGDMGLKPVEVKLGSAIIDGTIDNNQRQELREKLQTIGFELLDDQRQRTIEHEMKFIPTFPKEGEDINPDTAAGGVYHHRR